MSEQGKFWSILHLKCPSCRKGDLFETNRLFVYRGVFRMHKKCPVCGQNYELEPGFYYGALWTSYPLVLIIILPFLALEMFTDFPFPWFWAGVMFLLMLICFPAILRLGRALWLYIWVRKKG